MRAYLGFWILAALVAAAFVLAARGCGREPPLAPAARAAEPPPLPRLGTVGDFPPEKETLLVEVEADGQIRAGGKGMDLDTFRGVLEARADADREPDDFRLSRLHVVLRVHRRLPWRAAQWLMQECAAPRVRVSRILFAALPVDGGAEGTLAAYLPGVKAWDPQAPSGSPLPRNVVRVLPAAEGPPNAPGDLLAALREAGWPRGAPHEVHLDAGAGVPTERVLEAVDAALRSGVTGVLFQGAPLLRSPVLDPAACWIAPEGSRVVYEVNGRLVPPVVEGGAPLPAVARVRGRIAGSTPGPIEEECEDLVSDGK